MSTSDFFRRLIIHVTLALSVWYIAALSLERLVPGFVSPFINLPGVGLVVVMLSAIALAVAKSSVSRIQRIGSVALLVSLLGLACLFLWSRVSALGGLGLLLTGAAIVVCVLMCMMAWSGPDRA